VWDAETVDYGAQWSSSSDASTFSLTGSNQFDLSARRCAWTANISVH